MLSLNAMIDCILKLQYSKLVCLYSILERIRNKNGFPEEICTNLNQGSLLGQIIQTYITSKEVPKVVNELDKISSYSTEALIHATLKMEAIDDKELHNKLYNLYPSLGDN